MLLILPMIHVHVNEIIVKNRRFTSLPAQIWRELDVVHWLCDCVQRFDFLPFSVKIKTNDENSGNNLTKNVNI